MCQCTNWPKLYCNLLTLQNISCSDWSWNLHITMHNRVFRGSKLHLMRMGNIKCKNNAIFFPSISLQWGGFLLKQHECMHVGFFYVHAKGQLISECLFGVLKFPKNQRKIWQISVLENKKWSNQQSRGT